MSLSWTKEHPKVDGLYWYSFDGRVTIYSISMPSDPEDESEVYICYMGTELFDTEWPDDGYWMGPISKPEQP